MQVACLLPMSTAENLVEASPRSIAEMSRDLKFALTNAELFLETSRVADSSSSDEPSLVMHVVVARCDDMSHDTCIMLRGWLLLIV